MVVLDDVVWVSDPERGWRLISVEQRPGSLGLHNQVAVDDALGLSGILNEDSVTHVVVCDVLDDVEVVHTVNGDGSVVSLMNGVTLDEGLGDVTNHVEMDGVATEFEGLAHVVELTIEDATDQGLIAWGVQHDVSTVLVHGGSLWVTLILDVTGEQTDFGSHVDGVAASIFLGSSIMLELEGSRQSEHLLLSIGAVICDRLDGHLLRLVVIERG